MILSSLLKEVCQFSQHLPFQIKVKVARDDELLSEFVEEFSGLQKIVIQFYKNMRFDTLTRYAK